jgi:hypothetical protein
LKAESVGADLQQAVVNDAAQALLEASMGSNRRSIAGLAGAVSGCDVGKQ